MVFAIDNSEIPQKKVKTKQMLALEEKRASTPINFNRKVIKAPKTQVDITGAYDIAKVESSGKKVHASKFQSNVIMTQG